jgi:hypothetical protein
MMRNAIFHFIHQRIWQRSNLLPKGFVRHCNHLAEKKIAVAPDTSLVLFESEPKNPRILHKTSCRRDDDSCGYPLR